MSGLIALLDLRGAPIDADLLRSMTAAQRFRGPDGEGIWHGGPVGLGHTLHGTSLEAERAVQPLSLDGRLFISADARVDARDELCVALRGRGVQARLDAPDADLLLKAYDIWGEACFEYVLGDFSFALWDAPRQRLVCAVDALGVKPFFYTERGGLFAGSNSLECLHLHPRVRNTINEAAIGDLLLFEYYQRRDVTIYADIERIPPGHYLVVESGRLNLKRYFSLPQPTEVRFESEAACLAQFEELLARAVRDRLRVPKVAVWMSGGLDSSLVALTAKRELSHQFADHTLQAFTSVFDHLIPDEERHYAQLVAQSLDIPITFDSYDGGELFDWIDSTATPEPVMWPGWGSSLRHGQSVARRLPVVLTGWDGDALLLHALHVHWGERLGHLRFGDLLRELAWFVGSQRAVPPLGLRTRLASFKARLSSPPLPRWLRPDFRKCTALEQRWAAYHRPHVVSRSREPSQQNFALPEWGSLFDSFDAAYLRMPTEARHPLLDLRLVQFAFGLPAVPWCVRKELLRRSLHALPSAIRLRPKTTVRGDPDRETFRQKGLSRSSGPWRSEVLDTLVDCSAVQEQLECGHASAPNLHELLRVVAIGLWLNRATNRPLRVPNLDPT